MLRWLFIRSLFASLSICCLASTSSNVHAQQNSNEGALPNSWSEQIGWRSIGPANMMGRITSIAVYEADTKIWWAASASGGLLKTTNNGVTFEHQFDNQNTVSIGDVQVSKTNPDLLWVGTGESNPRNSVSWGDGVYKSTDGGKTWKNMGLNKIFQTGRIAIHPENHDIVYVGALGRLWGPNEERGLFKTTDGGKNWEKIFYVDDKTGVIDVQMNPKNSEELLIATYERMRDGFDGNDPVKKYGDGSAIYKTVDGGKTFTRMTQGLPTCKLGRIGLNYFLGDPNIVAAIIESEKIAQEPENAAFAGIRGENADVGAKITTVTDDGPADKAGLKENDIVISIDGELIYSYDELLKGIRKHKSGETAKLVVSRERKPVDIVIELDKRPAPRNGSRRGRSRRSAFTGTLGGQAANLQGQQGDNEAEYGGVYLSTDGGNSWERINTLNPRPMYYSQVRIDPVDSNNMYVLGTSLYRSQDAGQTFTGDGGRGIHVDHHALWIDPADPRHMILGNDGGIYVTYDRMDHWDHHNHAALGQFYHVGINSRVDYHVYGGLQDNGSWGGPARVSNDSGPVNTDWYRVGGGDGFITLADPDDPDQIYFESQNGAMGRIHLETGERGFIRPRAPRGTRYRFNWKTPFILSPHNSKIHYSAGNYVFRSFDQGRGVKAISPEITNSNRGAGSAITESPVQAGVLYVGTTDGAVWMTKDGGNDWVALYSKPEPDKDADETENKETSNESNEKQPEPSASTASEKKPTTDLNGTWMGEMVSDRFPEGQAPTVTLNLKVDEKGNVSGEIETRRGPQDITSGQFDSESGELSIKIETNRGTREFSANVKGNKMSGEMSMRNGQFKVDFTAEKEDDSRQETKDPIRLLAQSVLLTQVLAVGNDDDPISGTWNGVVRGEQIPNGEITFTLEFKLTEGNQIRGTMESPQAEVTIDDGEFNAESKKLYFSGENENFFLDFEAVLAGTKMTGDVTVNDQISAEFEATLDKRAKSAKQEEPQEMDQQETESTQVPTPGREQERGFLGVQFAQNAEQIEVVQVIADSGAEKAGLKPGDVLQTMDGRKLESVNSVLQVLRSKSAGDSVAIEFEREGSSQTIEATLGTVPRRFNNQGQRQSNQRPSRPPMDDDAETAADQTEQRSDAASKESESNEPDLVSGTWKGTMTSPQGEREITIVLNHKSSKQITGTYETSRGEREINEGSYNPESKTLTLISDNDQFSLEFVGQLADDSYSGELDFNAGAFTMEFDVKRVSDDKGSTTVAEKEKPTAKPTGKTLEDLLPGPRWVSSLHASKFKAERCYASFDGHRSNDDLPHVFVTEDFGTTWQSLKSNLPDSAGSVRVIREDIKNENVLYLGCEFGAWFSVDRGQSWTKFKQMPTVSVHEFAQHPTLDDIVAATHGRSLWVGDVSLLRQTSANAVSNDVELYRPRDVIMWRSSPRRGSSGTRKFVGQNPSSGAKIAYSLGKNARSVELAIRNLNGDTLKRFDAPAAGKGLHIMDWDLRRSGSGNRGRFGPRIPTGRYHVELRVDGEIVTTVLTVKSDPTSPQSDGVATETELDWWLEFTNQDEN